MKRYFVFFFISGFCSILYELVWLRLAMASFGVTTARKTGPYGIADKESYDQYQNRARDQNEDASLGCP